MKRFLSFMLGVIFGIVFLLGAVGIAAYSSVTVVHPNEIYADIETYLGDLGDVSLLQAYYNILDLYEKQTGNVTNAKLYSVGDFLEDNHISNTTEDGKTMAFGIVMPKELLDAPLFEYFNTNVDENGHTGIQRALKQIKLSSVPAIVNTFATPNEGGEPVISEAVIAQLDSHSVFDLVYGESGDGETPNIVANLSTILQNVTLADFVPALRPDADTDNIMKNLLLAVGQAPIGLLIAELTGDGNILGSLNEDGSLAAIGRLTIADILGDSDPLISSLLGNICVADFVNEQGDFAIVEAMDSIRIAGLFGLTTRSAQVEIDKANVISYYETNADDTRGALIWSVGVLDGKYYISLNAENDAVATTWMEGQLVCAESHQHQANCFDYLWYAPCKVEHEHTDEYTVEVNGVATAYLPVERTSVFYTLANLKLSSLFDDTGAINIENLLAQFDKHSVDAILGELLADNIILEQISQLLELDDMTISDLLAEGGLDKLLAKVTDAPIARILEIFEIEGLDIVTDIVGDMSVNQLIEGGYENISLGGLLGLVKREMDVVDANGNLPSGAVVRDFTTTVDEEIIVELSVAMIGEQYYLSTTYDKDADKLADDYVAPVWYEGQLKCDVAEHNAFADHDKDCFVYALYQACTKEDPTHNHATEDAFFLSATKDEVDTINYYVEANSLFTVLGNMTIGGLIEGGFDTLFDELTNMKLADLFDMLGLAEMEGALEALSKLTIKELMEGGYNNLTLGSLLGYKRCLVSGTVDEGSVVTFKDNYDQVIGYVAMVDGHTVLSTDGENWYNGKLACTEEHEHNFDCYENLWYSACPIGCVGAHEHVTIGEKPHTPTTGIFGLLVDLSIGDITTNPNSLMDKVFETKLGQLLDDDLEGLMATIAEYSIKELMDPSTLNGLGIGDILSYVRYDVTEQLNPANGWDVNVAVDDKDTALVKQNSTTGEYAYFDANNGKWYAGQMHCKKEAHAHVEPDCGNVGNWTCDKDEHAHDIDCYGYIWYAKCNDAGCTDHDGHVVIDGERYGKVDGIFSVLADLTISDLTGGINIMDKLTSRLTLGDIFGDNIPEILKSLKDAPIAELSGAIESTKVGDLLGFSYNETESRWEKEVGGVKEPLTGIEKAIADKTITDLKDFGSILDEVTLGDVLDPVPEMLEALANVKIPNLATEIETLQVGKLLGYELIDNGIDQPYWAKEVGGTMQPLTGMEKVLAGKAISDLKDFGSILDEVTLGDVLDPVPSMLEKLKDKPITKLGDEIDKLVVGDFLGYGHLSVDVTTADWTAVVGVDGLYKHTDGTFAKVDTDEMCYVAELTCADEGHEHDVDCYQYKWYQACNQGCTGTAHPDTEHQANVEGDYFVAVTGITAKLAGKTINDLSNLTDLVNDLTLTDVFGQGNVPSMLGSIANEKISNLEDALNKIYVGEFLGYEQGEKILVCSQAHTHNDDLAEENCCYQKKLICNQTHTHTSECYVYCYVWTNGGVAVEGMMAKISNERLDTLSSLGETIKTFTLSDVMGQDVPGMLKGIANTPIGELDTALDSLYLGEILEYTKHPATEATIADCTTAVVTLNGEVVVKTNSGNTAYVLFADGVWYDAVVSCIAADCTHTLADCYGYLWYDGLTPATGITAKLANERVSNLGDLGDTIQSYSLYDVLGDSVPSMLDSIKYEPINNLNNSINDIYVGEFLGYTKVNTNGNQTLDCQDNAHTLPAHHTAECYYDNYNWTNGSTTVDGMMAKIANKKVGNLGSLSDDISTFTFAEIMGRNDGDNAIIKELYDTPVGDIGSKMDTMMLGTAMGYYRKAVCGESHSHVDACYEVDLQGKHVWYTESACTNKVGAPQSAFVNSTLQNIGGDIDSITLGELVNVDEGSSMLNALKDTPINGIATAIDGMALGTSMGFVRREMNDSSYTITVVADAVKSNGTTFVKDYDGVWYDATTSCKESHTHTADCYDYVWYEQCKAGCEHAVQDHVVIDGANHTEVGGLNAKMSNLTIGNMSGKAIVDIVTELSMRDMIDSGILQFTEDEMFKLAILFGCDTDEHKVTALMQDFSCDLAGYFAYNAAMTTMSQPTLTTEQFYRKAHGIANGVALTEEQLAHRDIWQDCSLTEFIEALLAGF